MSEQFTKFKLIVTRATKTKPFEAEIRDPNNKRVMKTTGANLSQIENNLRSSGHIDPNHEISVRISYFYMPTKDLGKEAKIIIQTKNVAKNRLRATIIDEDEIEVLEISAPTFKQLKRNIYETGIISHTVKINRHYTYFHLPLNFEYPTQKKTNRTPQNKPSTLTKVTIRLNRFKKNKPEKRNMASIQVGSKKPFYVTGANLRIIRRKIKKTELIPTHLLSGLRHGKTVLTF